MFKFLKSSRFLSTRIPFASSNAPYEASYHVYAIGAALMTSTTYLSAEEKEVKMEKEKEVIPMDRNALTFARRNSMRAQKTHYPYVIVGAGTTAQAAIEAIRQTEPKAEILLLSEESNLPRMDSNWRRSEDGELDPISDSLLDTFNEWRRHVSSSLANEPDAYSTTPVTLLLGRKDMHFDAENKRILLEDGTEVCYDKCLLATAGKPRQFYVLDSNRIAYTLKDRINPVTTLADFQQLEQLLRNEKSNVMNVSVVGGGFLGCEIASALASSKRAGKPLNVQQIFVESSPLSRYLPEYLSQEVGKRLVKVGVDLIGDKVVTSIKPEKDTDDTGICISLIGDEKTKLSTDYVALCSTHIDPTIQLAQDSCLEIDAKNHGIVVNAQFEAMAGLYVAGNLASYYDRALGRRRVDMYDHAVNSGLVAGRNMVASKNGKAKSYLHQPMFRSQMAGIDLLLEGKTKHLSEYLIYFFNFEFF